ncbi:hypothetical protein KCP78_20325 [Salmonella enterica subsp. enterica]|nr:hypothetical protein KCP78_20325 [Salmonella enterica subsp. enterica]
MTTLSTGIPLPGMKSSAATIMAQLLATAFLFYGGDNRTADQQNGRGIRGKEFFAAFALIRQHAIGNGCFAPAAKH